MAKRKGRNWPRVIICTDGSCEPNPGEAGWGAVLIWPDADRQVEAKGYIGQSTNNVAELTAAIEALKLLDAPHRVELRSDSQWLVNCATWYWQRHAHRELWQQLNELAQTHSIYWRWIRGHAGDPCNEQAHQLAEAGRLNDPADPSTHRGYKPSGV